MTERVLERRQLTVRDILAVFPILARNRAVVQELVRAAQSGEQAELVAAGVSALALLPDLLPWLASLYDLDPDALAAQPADALLDYLEGVFRGEDAKAFFSRLERLLSTSTGLTT